MKLCADTVAVIVHVCAPQPVAYLHGLELVSCEAHDVWLPIRVIACAKIVFARSRLGPTSGRWTISLALSLSRSLALSLSLSLSLSLYL